MKKRYINKNHIANTFKKEDKRNQPHIYQESDAIINFVEFSKELDIKKKEIKK